MNQTCSTVDVGTEIDFQMLKEVMNQGTGINFDYYRESYLKRRLKVRLTLTKTHTYSKYMQFLKTNPEEFKRLIDDVTVNYTKFFRDTDVYDFLKDTLLPKLIFSSKPWIRIWSAGCATGEEPYSLAMLIHEVSKIPPKERRVTIYASDIDETVLDKSARGEYDKRATESINKKLLEKYFDFEDNIYKVKPFIKEIIHFEKQDLMAPPVRRNLDLILCRNVMIYFSREIQQIIYGHFYNSLRPEGYLISGKTEFIAGEASQKFVDVNSKCRIYQKG
ncbi:MAG: protein-glutamate O-methyltransferase CheR [Candidatus Bathyarchaeota archaeon]|nr:MAG: protein-glutamate O-methyltransferase CheR [Candidatus Bathyarchaeota archaeon]